MESVAEGLWELGGYHEERGEVKKAVKCLEAIVQSGVSFLPIIEVKTRLRIADLLLKYTHNLTHAKSHLERAQLLLMSIPSSFELKCRTYSLLSQCYHLMGATPSQKQILNKGLALSVSSAQGFAAKLWSCNFSSQLASAQIIEGDYYGSLSSLDIGYNCASEIFYPELQMFFATSSLHVHLMQWDDVSFVERAVIKCNEIWESIQPDKRQQCTGLRFYSELLNIFYLLRICDYKNTAHRVENLDAAMKADMEQMKRVQELKKDLDAVNINLSESGLHYKDKSALSKEKSQLEEQLNTITGSSSADRDLLEPAYFGNLRRAWGDKLELAPPPIDGEWLPKSAIYALVDLMMIVYSRPKGQFKECGKRIQSGVQILQDELVKLGIDDNAREVDLQPSAIWIAGVYLMLLMQFLENKVCVDLTRSEFVEAQKALVQMRNWFSRFPTILQACESTIEMLRGQYAHSVAAYGQSAFHFMEAAKLTQSKSCQAMCQIYAAISHICTDGPESSAQAVDLIGPVYRMMDSFVGVREKTGVLFAYGFLLMRQNNLQEARVRLASGLQVAHSHLGNLQLVSQYLTVLGNLALALHDTGQAKEILRSALTLAKKNYDIPTQIWVLTNLTGLYQQVGEKKNEVENYEYQTKKLEDLQRRINDARSTAHHFELIEETRIQIHLFNENEIKHDIAGPPTSANLDIPESVGLPVSAPASSSRLMDVDIARRGKRKI